MIINLYMNSVLKGHFCHLKISKWADFRGIKKQKGFSMCNFQN